MCAAKVKVVILNKTGYGSGCLKNCNEQFKMGLFSYGSRLQRDKLLASQET